MAVISLQADWKTAERAVLPVSLADWILESGSLTARLKAHCQQFRLDVLTEEMTTLPDFLVPLLPETLLAQKREVLMYCDNAPAVYAQSWFPQQTMQALTALSGLGQHSLGEFLFRHKELVRGEIETTELTITLPQAAITQIPCRARRSVFRLGEYPLLVAEVFLPTMMTL